jgi:hypothetical protein
MMSTAHVTIDGTLARSETKPSFAGWIPDRDQFSSGEQPPERRIAWALRSH